MPQKSLPDAHRHVPGYAVAWDGGRYVLDFKDADDGRLWFGQCVGGWMIYRALLRRNGYWAAALMTDESPRALRWLECEGHCAGPTTSRAHPSKQERRRAKVTPHRDAINVQLRRVARTRVSGVRACGRPLQPCSETVADAGLTEVRAAQGRPRNDKKPDEPGGPFERSVRMRERDDDARMLPEQTSVDLWARGMAEDDDNLLTQAHERAPREPWPLRPPPGPRRERRD